MDEYDSIIKTLGSTEYEKLSSDKDNFEKGQTDEFKITNEDIGEIEGTILNLAKITLIVVPVVLG